MKIEYKDFMTPSQVKKLESFGDRVLDYWISKANLVVVTMRYGTKYYCQFFIGPRGGTTGHEQKIYRNYDPELGLTGFMYSEYL